MLRTVADQQQYAAFAQSFYQAVQHAKGRSIGPLQVLKDHDHGPEPALAQYDALDGLDGMLAPLQWFQAMKGVVGRKRLQEIEDGRNRVLKRLVEKQ